MPKSRNEWLFLVALLACLVFPYTAKAGSASPISEQEASELIMGKSEGLLHPKQAREKECGARLADERIIHDYSDNGWSAAKILSQAANAPDLVGARRAAVLKLIIEAHQYEGGPKAWFANAWNACVDGA